MTKIKIFAPALLSQSLHNNFDDSLWAPDRVLDDRYLTFNDSCIEFNVEKIDKYLYALLNWESKILQLSLYVDEIYIPDVRKIFLNREEDISLADSIVSPRYISRSIAVHYDYPFIARRQRNEFERVINRLDKLIDARVIRTYDVDTIYTQNVSERLFGQKRDYTTKEILESWPETFVAEGILFAEQLKVPYTALTSEEFSAIVKCEKELQKHTEIEQHVITMLAKIEIPGFTANADTLVSARINDENFDAFRKDLRQVFRQQKFDVYSANFENESKQFNNDILLPHIAKLEERSLKTRGLKEHLRSGAISFASGAISALTISPSIASAIAGGSISTLSRILLQRVFDVDHVPSEARFYNEIKIPNIRKVPNYTI